MTATRHTAPVGGPDPPAPVLVMLPGKLVRFATMTHELLEEAHRAPLDEAARKRMRVAHESAMDELAQVLAPDVAAELARLAPPLAGEHPTQGELRVAEAQLIGWLDGLLHGTQLAVMAEEMAIRSAHEPRPKAPSLPGRPRSPGRGADRDGQGPYL